MAKRATRLPVGPSNPGPGLTRTGLLPVLALVPAAHRAWMQMSFGVADTGARGAPERDAEELGRRAVRSAELGAAMEEVLAEVWRRESWWAVEDHIDNAVRYLTPDRTDR